MTLLVALLSLVLLQACGRPVKDPALRPAASGSQEAPTTGKLVNVPSDLLAPREPGARYLSLARLLSDPDALHGKAVVVAGFAHIEFEGNQLCLHSDDVEYMVLTNCVWLDLPLRPEVQAISDRYVMVTGRVDAQDHGHMGMFQATLTRISQASTLPRRAELSDLSDPAAR